MLIKNTVLVTTLSVLMMGVLSIEKNIESHNQNDRSLREIGMQLYTNEIYPRIMEIQAIHDRCTLALMAVDKGTCIDNLNNFELIDVYPIHSYPVDDSHKYHFEYISGDRERDFGKSGACLSVGKAIIVKQLEPPCGDTR